VVASDGDGAQLIQNPAFAGIIRPRIAGRDHPRHGFALGQRQAHPGGASKRHLTNSAGASTPTSYGEGRHAR
jgi:hypothetical protein